MRGGRIEITDGKIFDRNQNENAQFKVVTHRPSSDSSFAGLEEYLLETEKDFPKSFLAKFVRIKLRQDDSGKLDVAFVSSYDSIEDYNSDHISGEGTFQRTECSNRSKDAR